MAHSLGLTLYNLRGPAPRTRAPGWGPRPEGALVWLHAPTPEAVRPLLGLAGRLRAGEGASLLLTTPGGGVGPPMMLTADCPDDTPALARAFLDHWRPDAAVFSEGELRPALVHEAQQRAIPLAMVEARNPFLPEGRDGWWPGLVRGLLAGFRHVVVVDEPAARVFRRAGARPSAVMPLGRMEQPSAALACTEAERDALSRLLASRPVWLAAGLPEAEEALVIAAHRAALRLAHRLLLIVAPLDVGRTLPLARRMEEVEGWTVARRSEEQEPDADVQVLITDGMTELGLWLRLAPITYLGGSLTPGGAELDPSAPAAHGSAVVHGPRGGRHGGIVGRLAAAQASVLVGSGADLAEALGELLAADRVARLAQAAWAVTSDGAEVTDRVADLVRDMAGLGQA